MKEKFLRLLERWGYKKENAVPLIAFVVISVIVFIGVTFFNKYFPQITLVILLIELTLLVTVTWALAGHAVLKSLFAVGASLSLVIFLAQAYCAVPNLTQAGNEALKTLVGFSILYIGVEFLRSLFKEAVARTKTFKEINNQKNPWVVLVPFALFTGLFVWQIVEVISPILQNLCVYK